jgi:HD-like signal output (HDOD) protein
VPPFAASESGRFVTSMIAAAKTPAWPLANVENALVARLRADHIRVPPYPAIAARVQQVLADPKHTTASVAAVVAADATLAAAIVARASSAASGARISSLAPAIARLGVDEVIRLALATSLAAPATAPGPLSGLRRDTWRRSLVSARLAHDLAAARQVIAEEAYIAGLLHDFGEVVAIAGIEGLAAECELPTVPWAAWQQLVRRLHVEFGMVVAARWNLPPALCDVMGHHHEPGVRPLPKLIAMVDQIIDVLDGSPGDGVAALVEIPGLTAEERQHVAVVTRQVVEQMADLEAGQAQQARGQTIRPSVSKIAPAAPPSDSWDVSFEIACKGQVFRATRLSGGDVTFVGRGRLEPNWLTDLELRYFPEPTTVMVNIASCETSNAGHVIVAKPFALGGAVKTAWLQMVSTTRPRR